MSTPERTRGNFLPGLTRGNLGRELLAGVTLLALAVPLNIGYAQIAGLPATAGLYAMVLPALVFAVTASSRQVVAAPDAAAAALVASSLLGLTAAGSGDYAAMAAAQAILGGIFFLLFAVFKLGFLANFLSKPILIGFVGGLALEVLISQVAKMLGVAVDGSAEFFEKAADLFAGLGSTNVWALSLSLGSLAVLLVGRKIRSGAPWALIVLVVAAVSTVALDLADRGVDVLGSVPSGPPILSIPRLDLGAWLALVPSALALTVITVAEGLLVIRSYSEKNGYPTDSNRDLASFGVANVVAGLSSSFTIGSSTSRTAAMDQAGSRSQVPSIVVAVLGLLLLLFGTALLEDIPSPAIGAIVAVAVFRLVGAAELRKLRHLSRFEFWIGITCMAGVLVLGPIRGVFVAFVFSLINLARRASNPPIDVLEGEDEPQVSLLHIAATGETVPGVIVMRFAAPIFFANSHTMAERIRSAVIQAPNPVVAFVFDLEASPDIDVTGAETLATVIEWLYQRGISIGFTRLRPDMRARLDHFDLLASGTEYATNRDAVQALRGGLPEPETSPLD